MAKIEGKIPLATDASSGFRGVTPIAVESKLGTSQDLHMAGSKASVAAGVGLPPFSTSRLG
jgi:hypothetical protein